MYIIVPCKPPDKMLQTFTLYKSYSVLVEEPFRSTNVQYCGVTTKAEFVALRKKYLNSDSL